MPGTPEAIEAVHAKRRDRRVLLSILAGLPFRLLQVASGVLLVPLAYHYLGGVRFGLWAAITALAPIIALADLGIGNGLITAVAGAAGRDDTAGARRSAASGLAAVTAIALFLSLILAGSAAPGDWAGWFNVAGTDAAVEARPTALLFIACSIALLPVTLAARLRAGLQESFISSFWEAAGVIAALGGFILLTRLDGSMAALALAMGGAPVVAGLCNLAWLYRQHRWLRPRFADIDMAALRPVLRLGFLYFVLMGSTALANATDSIVAIRLLGPDQAGMIAICGKIFGAGQALVLATLTPLWPAFSEALARRDLPWVRRTMRRALLAGIGGASLFAFGLAFTTNALVHLWIGPAMTMPTSLLAANTAWLVLVGAGNALGMLLNGAGIVRLQIAAALAYGLIAFALKLVLPHYLDAAGIVWATVIGYGGIVVPLYAGFTWRYLRTELPV
jgi:O-antigen/teichoic acid export membrane protein